MSNIDFELEEMEQDLRDNCTAEVNCINCGKLVMYAQPDPHKDIQLPDMICLKCKRGK